MSRYQNSTIYAIRSYKTDKYILDGCCCSLARRKADLKKLKAPLFHAYAERYPDFYLEIVMKYPCDNKEFLQQKINQLGLTNFKFLIKDFSDFDIPDRVLAPVIIEANPEEVRPKSPQPPPLPKPTLSARYPRSIKKSLTEF
jgi:hypothetical protein